MLDRKWPSVGNDLDGGSSCIVAFQWRVQVLVSPCPIGLSSGRCFRLEFLGVFRKDELDFCR